MSLIDTIEADLSAAFTAIEGELEKDLTQVWSVVKTALLNEEPKLVADLAQIAQLVVNMLGANAPMSQIATSVLNTAESLGKTEVRNVEGNLLQGLLSLAVAAATPKPPPAS